MKNLHNKLIYSLMGLFLFFGSANAASAPDPGELLSVTGFGSSPIEGVGQIKARRVAEAMALRNAIGTLILAYMEPAQVRNNKEFLEANIYTPVRDYVQSYKYIKQAVSEDETAYEVNVEYTFFVTYIRNVLSSFGLQVKSHTLPTVVVIIDEQTLGGLAASTFLLLPSSAEQSLKKELVSIGYKVISRDEVKALKQNRRVQLAIKGEPLALKWLAERFSASFIILGSAVPTRYSATAGQSAYAEGRVAAKIYKGLSSRLVWNKAIIKRIEGSAGATSIKVLRIASDKFNEEVAEFFGQEISP